MRLGLCEPNSRLRIDALKKLLSDYDGKVNEVLKVAQETGQPQPELFEQILPSMQLGIKRLDTLYIDCLPNGAVKDAHTIVASLLPEVLKQVGEQHIKFVAYGKGTAALAVAVQKHLNENVFGDMFADSRTIDADVLAVLVRNAETVVRGLR